MPEIRQPILLFSMHMNAVSSLPAAAKERVAHLNQLLNTANESCNAFKALSLPWEHWDDVIIYFLKSKLAPATRIDWVKEIEKTSADSTTDFPKFATFKTFLEDRIRTLDLVDGEAARGDSNSNQNSDQRKGHFNKQKKSVMNVTTQKSEKSRDRDKCTFCSGDHFVGYCKTFANCSQVQRREHASTARLCYNCLSTSHTADNCSSETAKEDAWSATRSIILSCIWRNLLSLDHRLDRMMLNWSLRQPRLMIDGFRLLLQAMSHWPLLALFCKLKALLYVLYWTLVLKNAS